MILTTKLKRQYPENLRSLQYVDVTRTSQFFEVNFVFGGLEYVAIDNEPSIKKIDEFNK